MRRRGVLLQLSYAFVDLGFGLGLALFAQCPPRFVRGGSAVASDASSSSMTSATGGGYLAPEASPVTALRRA